MRIIVLFVLLWSLCQSAPAQAADSRYPASTPYAGLPAAPLTSQPVVPKPPAVYVPLPPRLPAFLPSGGANLNEAWIQDGGARLYWNTLVIPRQLRMGGATFVDPASVPELLPPGAVKVVQPTPARRRRAAPRPSAAKSAKPVPAPANAACTDLTLPAKLPASANKTAETPSPGSAPAARKSAAAPSSASAGTAAPYTGAAPATAPSVPLPIMPALPVPPSASGASR